MMEAHSGSGNPKARLLIVEDHFFMREGIKAILQRDAALEVAGEAQDVQEAISRCREIRPDLILMDISIPRMDGWEATRILRGDSRTSAIPIIALTAHALADDRERAAEVGFTSYLAKPIEPRVVVAEVRRWIGEGAAKKPLGD